MGQIANAWKQKLIALDQMPPNNDRRWCFYNYDEHLVRVSIGDPSPKPTGLSAQEDVTRAIARDLNEKMGVSFDLERMIVASSMFSTPAAIQNAERMAVASLETV